jgi:hypothetical protein
MSISASDLKPLKTDSQKTIQALNDDLGIGIGAEEAARRQAAPPKPKGQKPLYHSYFGQYFFWVVTGIGKSEMPGFSAEEYYGPTKSQQHPSSVIQWITNLLNSDKEEVSFNQYAYLKKVLQEQLPQHENDAPNFRPVVEWLQEQADKADIYASLFLPARYNVRTLLDAGERDLSGPVNLARPLTPEERERLEYYQQIGEKCDELEAKASRLCEKQQNPAQQLTDVEFQQLEKLEEQVRFLSLSELDQSDKNRLYARATRKQKAAEFKKGLEERLLGPSPSGFDLFSNYPGSFQPDADSETGIFPPRIIFTLSELTREFDANIELCDTPGSRASYAVEQLKLFDINRPHIVQFYDRWSEMDSLKITALNQILTELRSLYEQHQRQKLRSFRQIESTPVIAKFTPALPILVPSESIEPLKAEEVSLSTTIALVENTRSSIKQNISATKAPPAVGLLHAESAFSKLFSKAYSWAAFLRLLGPAGINIYDTAADEPKPHETAKQWAKVYGALQYLGYLPELSGRDAATLFRTITTLGSKSTINRYVIKHDEALPPDIRKLTDLVKSSLIEKLPPDQDKQH